MIFDEMDPPRCRNRHGTIDEFFKRQVLKEPVETVSCPACHEAVPKGKINSHLDDDCPSLEKPVPLAKKFKLSSSQDGGDSSTTTEMKRKRLGRHRSNAFIRSDRSSQESSSLRFSSPSTKQPSASGNVGGQLSSSTAKTRGCRNTPELITLEDDEAMSEKHLEIPTHKDSPTIKIHFGDSTENEVLGAKESSHFCETAVHALLGHVQYNLLEAIHCPLTTHVEDVKDSHDHAATNAPQPLSLTRQLVGMLPSHFRDLEPCLWQACCYEDQQSLLSSDAGDKIVSPSPKDDTSTIADVNENKYLPYYLINFLDILRVVIDTPDDYELFNVDDLKILRKFYLLSCSSQQLYVRLFSRKHKWIQQAKINYERIATDLGPSFQELIKNGFLECDDCLDDLKIILSLLPVAPIRQLCKNFCVKAGSQKPDMVEKLLLHCQRQRGIYGANGLGGSLKDTITKKAKLHLGRCFRLADDPRSLFLRVMMLYSLTDSIEDWKQEDVPIQLTTMLMANTGRMVFPPYEIFRKAKLFHDRDELLNYEQVCLLEMDILSAVEKKKWDAALTLCTQAVSLYDAHLQQQAVIRRHEELPAFLRRYTTGHVLVRCVHHRVEVLQKMRRYHEAVSQLETLLKEEVYCQNYYGRWLDRLALNLHQYLKDLSKCLEVIELALRSPRVTNDHKLALQERAQRIRKSRQNKSPVKNAGAESPTLVLKMANECHIEGRIISQPSSGGKSIFLSDQAGSSRADDEVTLCSVEEFALIHYRAQGYVDGFHAEGSALVSLFGLLLWEVIYSLRIPDAFRSPHQILPLDLKSTEFFESRKEQIDQQLHFLQDCDEEALNSLILKNWNSHEGQCCLVNWELFGTASRAQALATCIGSATLSKICRRFAENFRHFHSGIPDLTVWNPETRAWKMVEVKGPNDHLSHKQLLWLDYLQGIGVSVEVCYVKAVGAKRILKVGPKMDAGDS